MKLVGTGSPAMLTLRAKTCEVSILREVLRRRRGELVAAAGAARPHDEDAERAHDEMFLVAKLLDALARPVAPDQPREILGPTWVLDPLIRDAASGAVEKLAEAIEVFRADMGRLSADQLRAALDTAVACTTTLLGLDYVQNHGVE